MKGLLHRLADRATGTSMAVRSDARLALLGAAFPSAAEGDAPAPAIDSRSPISRASIVRPSADVPSEHGPAALTDATHPRQALPRPESRLVQQTPRLDVGAIDQDQEPLDATPFNTPPAGTARPAGRSAEDNGPVPPGMKPASGPPRRSVVRSSDQDLRRDDAPGRVVLEPPALELPALVPPAAAARARVAAPVGLPTRTSGVEVRNPGGRSERADVHIHIGCVEVTAVHEPAAPRRKRAPAQEPMSLDAYFTKRGRP